MICLQPHREPQVSPVEDNSVGNKVELSNNPVLGSFRLPYVVVRRCCPRKDSRIIHCICGSSMKDFSDDGGVDADCGVSEYLSIPIAEFYTMVL